MRKAKDVAELAALLMSENAGRMLADEVRDGATLVGAMLTPSTVATDAATLMKIGISAHRRIVRYCNGEGSTWEAWPNGGGRLVWTEADDAKKERADKLALERAQAIADRYGAKVKIGGDPRGFTFRLILASGRTNTFANDGWGIA